MGYKIYISGQTDMKTIKVLLYELRIAIGGTLVAVGVSMLPYSEEERVQWMMKTKEILDR